MTDNEDGREAGQGTESNLTPDRKKPPAPQLQPPEQAEEPAAAEEKQRPRPSFWQSVREILVILVIAVLVAIFLQSFVIKAFIIPSSSMEPTLQIGDRVMVDRMTYYFRKPRRGDIIVFRYPPTAPQATNTTNILYWPFEQVGETLHLTHRTNSSPFVKRVIATGGETIEIKKGQVFIDGKPIKEDYKVHDAYDMPPTKIPAGQLFCMGDNRPNSRDSRYWGTVPVRSVIGKVFLIWWPPSRFGLPKK
jgi:signal peptidase I